MFLEFRERKMYTSDQLAQSGNWLREGDEIKAQKGRISKDKEGNISGRIRGGGVGTGGASGIGTAKAERQKKLKVRKWM